MKKKITAVFLAVLISLGACLMRYGWGESESGFSCEGGTHCFCGGIYDRDAHRDQFPVCGEASGSSSGV